MKWVIFYTLADGRSKMSRRMNHAKAMSRYLTEVETKADGDTLLLMKVVSENGEGL